MKIKSIQALRGIAAVLVVVFHSHSMTTGYAEANYIDKLLHHLGRLGPSGVDVFFVISGFIMVFISYDEFEKSGASRDFLIKRIIRVVPTYWFVTSIMVILLLAIPSAFNKLTFDPLHVLFSYLFIPYNTGTSWGNAPVIHVGWTLIYEMYFYVIFSLLLTQSRKALFPSLLVIFCGPLLVSTITHVNEFISNPILLEFLAGGLIAHTYKNHQFGKRLSLIILLLGISLLILSITEYHDLHRTIKWGIPSALIVCGAIMLERNISFIPSSISKLGDSSYSLYLTQVFSIPVFQRIAISLDLANVVSGGVLLVLATAFSIIIGYVAYILIELKLTKNMYKLIYTKNFVTQQ